MPIPGSMLGRFPSVVRRGSLLPLPELPFVVAVAVEGKKEAF